MISKKTLKDFRRRGLTDLEIAARLNAAAGRETAASQDIFRARKKYDLVTEKEREHIRLDRRRLIYWGAATGSALGLAGASGLVYHFTRPPDEYVEAIIHEGQRDAWVKKQFKNLPPYVNPVYANVKLVKEVSERLDVPSIMPPGAMATTIADNTDVPPGNKNTSTIY